MLPTRRPVDIDMRVVLATQPPAMHRIAVSDNQPAVPSQADLPVLTDPLSPDSPNIAPCTDKLDAPVTPALLRRTKLIDTRSVDKLLEPLPAARPDVTITRRLCIDPAEPRHFADESDTHKVASHPDRPIHADAVADCRPIPPPTTVTLVDPEDATFTPPAALSMPLPTDSP